MEGDRSRAGATRDRGQTTQDFAVGISIFLLAVAFVFAFVPTVITPFTADAGGDPAQAERIAADALNETVTGETPNEIDASEFEDLNVADLGVRTADGTRIDAVNVTVVSLNASEDEDIILDVTDDDEYADQPAASVSRIVTVEGASGCDPACRLVVRVW